MEVRKNSEKVAESLECYVIAQQIMSQVQSFWRFLFRNVIGPCSEFRFSFELFS